MTVTDLNSADNKAARKERRNRKRECEAFLRDSMFEERKDLYRREGTAGQLDEAAVFTYDGPIGWRVTISLRADGTMPMRVSDDGDRKPEPAAENVHEYVREIRDGDVGWLEDNLP